MDEDDKLQLIAKAKTVLTNNDRGGWTMPAADLYPHQWFWDSCFIAIGLRHVNIERAQAELKSLLRGQWSNGMFPDMIFAGNGPVGLDEVLWDSFLSPYAPDNVATSGITQPPMLAEAAWLVGQKLPKPERRLWFKQMLPPIIRFHLWLYAERDPRSEGLVTLIHPYESGMDNSPPWIDELIIRGVPWWVNVIGKLHLDFAVNLIRRDTRNTRPGQRMSNLEALSFFVALRRLRKQAYDSRAILQKPYLAVQDLLVNCLLIRSNDCLAQIAKAAGAQLPANLSKRMELSKIALEKLWDEQDGQYYSRDYLSGELIRQPTIAGLLPLYAGCIPAERAEQLAASLKRRGQYKTSWPVPTVPQDSTYFNPVKYWQGPTWVNTNWFVINGLEHYGFKEEAEQLRQKTLELVAKSSFCEYYNPHNGQPAGATNFSWSAALTIDLLKK